MQRFAWRGPNRSRILELHGGWQHARRGRIILTIDTEREVPKRAVEALRAGLGDRLVAVVLFGSRARGDHRPDSDWDLLVIAKGLPQNFFDRHLSLKRALPSEYRGAISIVSDTPDEFEAHVRSLYLDIALDGRILYDPSGYIAQKLMALNRLMDHIGLYRERTESGDYWRWKEQPSGPWALTWEG